MNGPQHYRRSEELADKAKEQLDGEGSDTASVAALIALAQVHATLAAAAAAARGATSWQEVLGLRSPARPMPGNRQIRSEGPSASRSMTPEERIARRAGRRTGDR